MTTKRHYYNSSILELQSKLYIKDIQWKLEMSPLLAVTLYIQFKSNCTIH